MTDIDYNGITSAASLKDATFQNYLITDILVQAQGYGDLNNDALVRRWRVNGTYVTIPTMSAVVVGTDLAEFETVDTKSPSFAGIQAQLKADEIRVAFSDEALMNNNIANPMEMARIDGAIGFARALDKKIATALNTTPQTLSDWNSANSSFLSVAASASALLGNYKMTGIAMGIEAYGEVMSNIYAGSNRTNNVVVENGLAYLPGYNVPIIPSTSLADDAIFFTSKEAPGVYVVEGEFRTDYYRDYDTRSEVMQADVYNCVISNIRQTTSNTNEAVVKVELA